MWRNSFPSPSDDGRQTTVIFAVDGPLDAVLAGWRFTGHVSIVNLKVPGRGAGRLDWSEARPTEGPKAAAAPPGSVA